MATAGEIFNKMFGSEAKHQPTPGVTVQAPGATGNPAIPITSPDSTTAAANGVIPPGTDTTPPNPNAGLDSFVDLWKNAPVDPNAPVDDGTVFGKVNGDDLRKAASGMDFTRSVPVELQARIAAGGEDGVKASMEAMAHVSRETYAQASYATTKLIEQAIAKNNAKLESKLPSALRNHNTESLIKENPVLSHPAAAPMVAGLVNQFQTKYPDASPAEIKAHAEAYFTQFAGSLMQSQQAATNPSNTDTDWGSWLPK